MYIVLNGDFFLMSTLIFLYNHECSNSFPVNLLSNCVEVLFLLSQLPHFVIERSNNFGRGVVAVFKTVWWRSNGWERSRWRWRLSWRVDVRSSFLRAWNSFWFVFNKVSHRISPIVRIFATVTSVSSWCFMVQDLNISTLTFWLCWEGSWGRPSSGILTSSDIAFDVHHQLLTLILWTLHFYGLAFIRYIISVLWPLSMVIVIVVSDCWTGCRYSRMERKWCCNANIRIT